jgi:hypothetical protein
MISVYYCYVRMANRDAHEDETRLFNITGRDIIFLFVKSAAAADFVDLLLNGHSISALRGPLACVIVLLSRRVENKFLVIIYFWRIAFRFYRPSELPLSARCHCKQNGTPNLVLSVIPARKEDEAVCSCPTRRREK